MPKDSPNVEALIADGDLKEAAALLEQEGDHARAAELYEKVWDYPSAARVARAAGDLTRALLDFARAEDSRSLDEVFEQILQADDDTRRRAVAICKERGMPARAAQLLATLADPLAAAELYAEAGLELEAAILLEEARKPRRALDLYRAHLARGDDDPRADEARLRLGRLLSRFGRHAEAVGVLQGVAGELHDDARRATAAALYRAGYATAARATLDILRQQAPNTPGLEVVLADTQFAPVESDEGDATVLAGRYRLGDLLGSGGMGSVYLADDLLTGTKVAVKVFNAPGGARGRDAYKRFVREATITGKLEHPHIVRLLDFSEELGYLVLEQMQGGTLAQRVRDPLPLDQARDITLQLLDALSTAHQRGIVHRDLKPSNIFFSAVGAAKLGDFGVAHLQDSGQTQTGAFIGTVAYMSPEQITGVEVTFATDLYALGVTLFGMVTGRLPFEPPDLVRKHLEEPPPLPSSLRPGIPKAWDRLILRCLAKLPEERFESLDALRHALRDARCDGALMKRTPRIEDAAGEPRRRASDARYEPEVTLVDEEEVELVLARDRQLVRQVLLVRIATTPQVRERVSKLLGAAARGGHHLQRVLSIGPTPGNASLAACTDTPWVHPTDPIERLEACRALGEAILPLHRAEIGHGAIEADSLRDYGGTLLLTLAPALLVHAKADSPPAPSDDLDRLRALFELELPNEIKEAQGLVSWIEDALAAAKERHAEKEWRAAFEQAVESAPPGVKRDVSAE